MKRIVKDHEFGELHLIEGHYGDEDGPLAVWFATDNGEIIAKLSVNLTENDQTENLPGNCFYLKWWAENFRISMVLVESGWVRIRPDLGMGRSGNNHSIPVMELLKERMTKEQVILMVMDWQTDLPAIISEAKEKG